MKKGKFMKKILICLALSLLFCLDVQATTAPSSITLKSKSSLYYFTGSTDYISGYNFYRKELVDGTLAYCISNINTSVPAGKTLKLDGAIDDMGLNYIIQNGYPHKSFTGNAKKDYYITQSAIWKYFDETRGSNNWKNTSFTSSSTGMKKYVYELVTAAKLANNTEYPEPSITFKYENTNLSLIGDYFVSNPIQVILAHTKGTYNVKLENAPTGTIIKDINGNIKEEFNNEEQFVIYVPTNNLNAETGNVSVSVSATGVVLKTYSYTIGGKYQDVAPVTIFEEITDLISEKINFSYKNIVTKVEISKQDISTKQELPGATLIIKDKDNNEVERWISTNEPHYIEGLEAGDYTLMEIIAPEGYVLSTETINFTVKEDGSVTSVVMYNTLYEVPITDLDVDQIMIVFATLLVVIGTGLVVYHAKFSK